MKPAVLTVLLRLSSVHRKPNRMERGPVSYRLTAMLRPVSHVDRSPVPIPSDNNGFYSIYIYILHSKKVVIFLSTFPLEAKSYFSNLCLFPTGGYATQPGYPQGGPPPQGYGPPQPGYGAPPPGYPGGYAQGQQPQYVMQPGQQPYGQPGPGLPPGK